MSEPNEIFLQAAANIGAKLSRDALWAGNRCNWLGDSMEVVGRSWQVAHRSFGPDLYSGTSGTGLFLARLFALTGERLYRVTTEGALRHALSKLDVFGPSTRIGFYSGLTGIAYALLEVGEAFDREDFRDKALQIIDGMVNDDLAQQGLDVLNGCAGAIPVLLSIHRRYEKEHLLELANRCGQHLIDKARRSDYGWSWNTLDVPAEMNQQDLTGFSHGAAGIAWALLELHNKTRDKKYLDAANEAFRYEQHWFDREQGNWPDFRSSNEPAGGASGPSFMTAWCHGAAGIGLSRVRAYELTGDDARRAEAEAAIKTTTGTLGQNNFSLCHGTGGNAELLINASETFDAPAYKTTADNVGAAGIEQYQKTNTPWPCGVMGGGETPNLMLGLAGIGHFYLRLYDTSKTPSVLIITPKDEAARP
jgi:type 2 lantibiotic biosynthesis protein LanM